MSGGYIDFYGTWSTPGTATVRYHADAVSAAEATTTSAPRGRKTATATTAALGISKAGSQFCGWVAHRDSDDTWLMRDGSGQKSWKRLSSGSVPAGWELYVYPDGAVLLGKVSGGYIDFYGTWSEHLQR